MAISAGDWAADLSHVSKSRIWTLCATSGCLIQYLDIVIRHVCPHLKTGRIFAIRSPHGCQQNSGLQELAVGFLFDSSTKNPPISLSRTS
jgi:hypothetical protein